MFVKVRIFTLETFGRGFPLWLHFIPGIQFRTDNEPFKVSTISIFSFHVVNHWCLLVELWVALFCYLFQAEMQRFTAKIVDMMKQEKLYASQGGPIILSQVPFLALSYLLLIEVFDFHCVSSSVVATAMMDL